MTQAVVLAVLAVSLFGLVGLLVTTVQLWQEAIRSSGARGLVLGWLPPFQWVGAPGRLIWRQLLCLVLSCPVFIAGWLWYELSHMHFGGL